MSVVFRSLKTDHFILSRIEGLLVKPKNKNPWKLKKVLLKAGLPIMKMNWACVKNFSPLLSLPLTQIVDLYILYFSFYHLERYSLYWYKTHTKIRSYEKSFCKLSFVGKYLLFCPISKGELPPMPPIYSSFDIMCLKLWKDTHVEDSKRIR